MALPHRAKVNMTLAIDLAAAFCCLKIDSGDSVVISNTCCSAYPMLLLAVFALYIHVQSHGGTMQIKLSMILGLQQYATWRLSETKFAAPTTG